MSLQMLKKAMIAYVANSAKAIWSKLAYPLDIVGKKNCDLADYRIYGNSVQDGEPTPETPIEIQSVGELTTKNLLNYDLMGKGADAGLTTLKDYIISNLLNFEVGTYTLSYNIINATKYRLCWKIFSDNGVTELTTKAVSNEYATVKLSINSSTIDYGYYHTSNGLFQFNGDRSTSLNFVTITVLQPCYIGFYIRGGDMNSTSKVTEQQLELGETVTEYEPYHKYKMPVVVRGKNLLDMTKHTVELGYYSDAGGLKLTNNNYMRISPIKVEPNTTYRFSSNLGIYTFRFAKTNQDHSSVYISGIWIGGAKTSIFTTPDECNYVKISLYNTSGIADTSAFEWVMLEKGTGDGIFEPYTEPQMVNIYLDEPLRYTDSTSGIDYKDYIDFKKSVVVRKNFGIVFSGEEKWSKSNDDAYPNRFTFYMGGLKAAPNSSVNRWCSHYKHSTYNSLKHGYFSCTNSLSLYIYDDRFATVDELKAYLAEQAELGTPLTTVLPDYKVYEGNPVEEKIELPPLPQFKGTTIYEVMTDIQPSEIEVCYYGDKEE